MTVWKSPVLYLGIALLFAVLAAVAAPFVIDWNGYRADLENYGRKLTGREVVIRGPIGVRLFPWPMLTAGDVHIGNPGGTVEADFAAMDRIVIRMTLGGLFNGTLEVESVDIENPRISIERSSDGSGNWTFEPATDVARSGLLEHVRLDRISLHDGTLKLIDRRRGGEATLEKLNAILSAPEIAGPWRARGTVDYLDRRLDIGINTGAWKPDEFLKFGFRIAPSQSSGLTYSFDGARTADGAAGSLRVEPVTDAEGKGDAEGRLRPLVFAAQVKADFDAVTFEKIDIAPRDAAVGGAVLSGSARVDLGERLTAKAELSAPKLDIDAVAGAEARRLLRQGGALAFAGGLLTAVPSDVDLDLTLKATALVVGGETLTDAMLAFEANQRAVRVRQASADLPGRSRFLFSGVLFPGAASAELGGNLALESNDLRQLVQWLWPEGRDSLAKTWTGARGRLKLQADVDVTPSRLRFKGIEYQLDGNAGRGDLGIDFGGRTAIDARLDAGLIDADAYVPQGFGFTNIAAGGIARIGAALATGGGQDLRITLQSERLVLNGVEAEDVTVDLSRNAKGIDLRLLEVGSVEGARLTASGLVLDTGQGPDGAIDLTVDASDPRGLLRLLGALRPGPEPAWTAVLGETSVAGTVEARPGRNTPETVVRLKGSTGQLSIETEAKLAGAAAENDVQLDGKASISSTAGADILGLAGLTPAGPVTGAGKAQITAAGSMERGFAIALSADVSGAHVTFDGSFGAEGGAAPDGRIALRTEDAGPLWQAAGVPAGRVPVGPFSIDAALKPSAGSLSVRDITGDFAGTVFGGNLEFGPERAVKGEMTFEALALTDVMAAFFLGWTGAAPTLESSIVPSLPLGLHGEVWIKPSVLTIIDGLAVPSPQIGLKVSDGTKFMAAFGKDADGRNVTVEASAMEEDGVTNLSGKVALPIDLGRTLELAGGGDILTGEARLEAGFTARGRTIGAVLATLSGNGSYGLRDARLVGIDPEGFARLLSEAKDRQTLDDALNSLNGGSGVDLGSPSGIVTVVDGLATFLPLTHRGSASQISIKPIAEIAPGLLDIGVSLSLLAMPDLPPVEIAYAGPPDAMTRSEDTAALESHLGFRILQQGVKELERLQREQQRILEEEERSRREDEARLEAYRAQRDELRRRQRELQAQARQRVIDEERRIEAERRALDFYIRTNRSELMQRRREISVQARQRALDAAAKAEAERLLLETYERDIGEELLRRQRESDARRAAGTADPAFPGPEQQAQQTLPPLPRTKPPLPSEETTAGEPIDLLRGPYLQR